MDSKATISEANSELIEKSYKSQTELAKQKKIFGSPSFLYKGELFWGDDRLEDCIKWLKTRENK